MGPAPAPDFALPLNLGVYASSTMLIVMSTLSGPLVDKLPDKCGHQFKFSIGSRPIYDRRAVRRNSATPVNLSPAQLKPPPGVANEK